MTTKKLMQAAAGAGGSDKVYVEDVFSPTIYQGISGGSREVNNGIDFAENGGMVWFKNRDDVTNHFVVDSVRGGTKAIRPNNSSAETTGGGVYSYIVSFDDDGFTVGDSSDTNNTDKNYIAWCFRNQPGFFEAKLGTKSAGSDGTVSFSDLGSLGCVIAKPAIDPSASDNWHVWHKDLSTSGTPSSNAYNLRLNETSAEFLAGMGASGTDVTLFNGSFTDGDSIFYAFADGSDSSAQIFGEDEDESIVSTGTYEGTGATGLTISLGWEPQWMLIKNIDQPDPWVMIDNMRGMPISGEGPRLCPNDDAAEVADASFFAPRATGTEVTLQNTYINTSGETYVYIAIRRGPMKEPTAGTDVYTPVRPSASGTFTAVSGFPTDLTINKDTSSGGATYLGMRLTGKYSQTPASDASPTDIGFAFDFMNQATIGGTGDYSSWISWNFRRFPKVFDVTMYIGTGANTNHGHNLGAVPELMILRVFDLSSVRYWLVYDSIGGVDKYMKLNTDGYQQTATGIFSATPTATDIVANPTNDYVNESGITYEALLFASLAGISAYDSYTGTASDINLTKLGAVARFIMIKRTDSDGDWYVFDSVTGIVAGNEAYNLLNTTTGVQTAADYIDPHSSGFTITSSAPAGLNASGGTYIYLAFA